ncbi:hypothetical protein G6F22_018209 [Rhizopus arrhizus]|nr:hypothetical protein G6F22_018209 [Rhizopus arrhizus]
MARPRTVSRRLEAAQGAGALVRRVQPLHQTMFLQIQQRGEEPMSKGGFQQSGHHVPLRFAAASQPQGARVPGPRRKHGCRRHALISSSTTPRVFLPKNRMPRPPTSRIAVIIANTPAKPSTGYATPTMVGEAIEPIRAKAEAAPMPVARIDVG